MRSGRRWYSPADNLEDGWNLPVLVFVSYAITPYNWFALFGSDLLPWMSLPTRCAIGVVLTAIVGLCSMVTGAALKRYARREDRLLPIAADFIAALALLGTQAVLAAVLISTPREVPLLEATRTFMVLAQASIAGWFLKVFWDRATEIISAQSDCQTIKAWDDPVV